MSDLSVMEKLVFGEDAVRDPVTGRIFEQGLHSLPYEQQRRNFLNEHSIPEEKAARAAAAARLKAATPSGSA